MTDAISIQDRLLELMNKRSEADMVFLTLMHHPDLRTLERDWLIEQLLTINEERVKTDSMLTDIITKLRARYPETKYGDRREWHKPKYDKYQRFTEELK